MASCKAASATYDDMRGCLQILAGRYLAGEPQAGRGGFVKADQTIKVGDTGHPWGGVGVSNEATLTARASGSPATRPGVVRWHPPEQGTHGLQEIDDEGPAGWSGWIFATLSLSAVAAMLYMATKRRS